MASHWRDEFGSEYEVPDVFLSGGLLDSSWHNDVCPSFMVPELYEKIARSVEGDPDPEDIRVWVNHPDPKQREFPDAPRFLVCTSSTGETLYEGENAEAARAALEAASRLELLRLYALEAARKAGRQ